MFATALSKRLRRTKISGGLSGTTRRETAARSDVSLFSRPLARASR
jgi:hypothetical protein